MDEKEIFDLIDNISVEELIESIEKLEAKHTAEDDIDNETKEKIRNKLHKKIELYTDEPKFKGFKKDKKAYKMIKSRYLKAVIGAVAAMIIFVVLVNISPKIAYALENIPGIDKLVKLVKFSESYDKGFNKIVDEGRYQQINKTVKDKGAEFTVNTIAGDGLKLWIDYDFKGNDLIQGGIRFTNADGKSQLPWLVMPESSGKLFSVDRTSKLNEFNIEVDVYEHRKELKEPINDNVNSNEEFIKFMNEKKKYKVTTLVLPIKLDGNFFGEDSYKEYVVNENISNELAEFTIEKLEISPSRTNVYLKLNNEDYSSVNFENFRMVDSEGMIYHAVNDCIYSINTITKSLMVQLSGGPKSMGDLKLICNEISYVNNDEKYITVDINKKIVEENIYGVTLNKIAGNTVVLNVPQGVSVEANQNNPWNMESSSADYEIDGSCINTYNFKELEWDKLTFEVTSFVENKVEGFEIEIGE